MSEQQMTLLTNMLFELDSIIESHGLEYTVIGEFGTSIYETNDLPDTFDHISIAMTIGDIERLISIINSSNSLCEIESPLNNKCSKGIGFRYCNKESTHINIGDFGNHINYGEYISIYSITSQHSGSGIKKILFKIVNKLLSYNSRRARGCNKKSIFNVLASKLVCNIIGVKRITNLNYKLFKQFKYIDKWEDIKRYSTINVVNYNNNIKLSRSVYGDCSVSRVSVRNHSISVSPSIVGLIEEPKPIYSKYDIISSNLSYKRYLTKEKIQRLKSIQRKLDAAKRIRNSASNGRKMVSDAWNIYFMTRDFVELKRKYTSNLIKEMEDLLCCGQHIKCLELAESYLSTKAKWKKKNTPFIDIPEIERILSLAKM